jgi:hypothetical protein
MKYVMDKSDEIGLVLKEKHMKKEKLYKIKNLKSGRYATNSNGGTTWKKPPYVLSKLQALTKYSHLNLSDLEVEEFEMVKINTTDAESFYTKINDPKVELEAAKKAKEEKLQSIRAKILHDTKVDLTTARILIKSNAFNEELQTNIARLLHDYDELNKTKL